MHKNRPIKPNQEANEQQQQHQQQQLYEPLARSETKILTKFSRQVMRYQSTHTRSNGIYLFYALFWYQLSRTKLDMF